MNINKKEFLIIIIILSCVIIGWLPSKSIGNIAWVELIFLLLSIISILLLGTEGGLEFIRKPPFLTPQFTQRTTFNSLQFKGIVKILSYFSHREDFFLTYGILYDTIFYIKWYHTKEGI
jgi:hypothetical protein